MLTAFLRAFRTPDLRKKLLFTVFIIAVFRLGSSLPTPGVSQNAVSACLTRRPASPACSSWSTCSAAASLLKLTVFALGIMPYITASIILQLLAVVIPRLETLRQEGQTGQAKITQYTRYLTIGLAILQSTGIIALARSGQPDPELHPEADPEPVGLHHRHDGHLHDGRHRRDHVAGRADHRPRRRQRHVADDLHPGHRGHPRRDAARSTRASTRSSSCSCCWSGIAIIAFVALMEQAQRRIPVQYAKRMVGRRMYGGTSTYIPLKVNQAGVIPVIFASSLLYIPQLASQLFGQNASATGWVQWVNTNLVTGDKPIYALLFFLLIVFFTYFYVSITFNPTEVADNMKKYGGFIPGIRPGGPTAGYLSYVLSRLTAAGSLYLGLVALIPVIAIGLLAANAQFPLGGTSIMIAVGVGLDTVKQIESQLQQRNYEGFLR